ncbi:fructokinase [Galdieria sulphuraria]|uniref:Fructokinase n=1 Tax=Galdieria sulphuraria TaxID=130081 RepID=M2X789_GALSU|nr:fructokinase [Galdieria sulphuraria]EME32350.1 fructokinase [Galdieria sulphuraria]|eukprot:XP_005708870.1 fructokinase [Galdieria sulphuraria]
MSCFLHCRVWKTLLVETRRNWLLLQGFRRFSVDISCAKQGLVIGCGSNVVDLFVRVSQLPLQSSKVILSHDIDIKTELPTLSCSDICVGGVTLNHLSWASRFGVPCGLLAAQGTDSHGRLIREACEQFEISTNCIVVSSLYKSSSSVVFYDSKGERSILMTPGATSLMDADFMKEHFSSSLDKACIFTSEISQVPLSGVLYLLKLASEKGIASVLDVDVSLSAACRHGNTTALGSESEFMDCLNIASVVKFSLSESKSLFRYLCPSASYASELESEESILQLSNCLFAKLDSAKLIIVTMGSQGSILTSNFGSVFVPSLSKKPVVDTTGAGDAYLGGIIAGLYHFGFPESESSLLSLGQVASRCASLCCSVVGGLASLEVDLKRFLVDLEKSRGEERAVLLESD